MFSMGLLKSQFKSLPFIWKEVDECEEIAWKAQISLFEKRNFHFLLFVKSF